MHVLESQQFDRELMERLFIWADETASILMDRGAGERIPALSGRSLVNFFYERSTRTRASFEIAIHKLGGEVVFSTENASEYSSVAKGESLQDTIRTLCEGRPDIIVLRSAKEGSAKIAAEICDKYYPNTHIINAGDGTGQHPTQALLDMYTIWKLTGSAENHKVAIVGDLANGRTARSLAYMLTKFSGNEIYLVSPKEYMMGQDVIDHLKKHKVRYCQTRNIGHAIAHGCDVFYLTRPRLEYGTQIANPERYRITPENIRFMREDAIIMHPLPRVNEIDPAVDEDKRVVIFPQVRCGYEIRMALLYYLFSENNQ